MHYLPVLIRSWMYQKLLLVFFGNVKQTLLTFKNQKTIITKFTSTACMTALCVSTEWITWSADPVDSAEIRDISFVYEKMLCNFFFSVVCLLSGNETTAKEFKKWLWEQLIELLIYIMQFNLDLRILSLLIFLTLLVIST